MKPNGWYRITNDSRLRVQHYWKEGVDFKDDMGRIYKVYDTACGKHCLFEMDDYLMMSCSNQIKCKICLKMEKKCNQNKQ